MARRVCRPLSQFSDGRSHRDAGCLSHAMPKPVSFMAPHHHILPVEPMALLGHVFTHCGLRKSVFLKPFRQGSLCLPNVRCRTVGTFDGVHQTCLFFHREMVFRSHQTGSDRVLGVDVSHHTSSAEKASYLVGNLANIWDDDTPFTGGSRWYWVWRACPWVGSSCHLPGLLGVSWDT